MTNPMVIRPGRDASPGNQHGFTLLELMIVVLVISILAGIAVTSYQYAVRKSARSGAQGCLMEQSQFLERFYATHFTYASATLPVCSANVTARYAVTPAATPASAATAYIITATPNSATGQSRDACGTMTVNQAGAKTAHGTSDPACW